jgi:hypothetical protein
MAQTREGTMNPALWEALIAERIRDQRVAAARSRCARRARRTRHAPADDRILTAQVQPCGPQPIRLGSA